ncbi:matrix protein [Daphne virus 1]|nr:matrix protein [Daphne virus 1]
MSEIVKDQDNQTTRSIGYYYVSFKTTNWKADRVTRKGASTPLVSKSKITGFIDGTIDNIVRPIVPQIANQMKGMTEFGLISMLAIKGRSLGCGASGIYYTFKPREEMLITSYHPMEQGDHIVKGIREVLNDKVKYIMTVDLEIKCLRLSQVEVDAFCAEKPYLPVGVLYDPE